MTARPFRQKLLSSAAMLGAVSIAGLASPARAIPPIDNTRVIQATPTADAGHSYTPGAALDIIDINAPTAIINWAPLDPNNPIGLVKANGEARFQSANDFAVLNRITPTNGNTATFEGAVTSFVNGNPGGTVMFYSADGFIIAPTGTFNVGSLVLTTGDVTGAFTGNSFKTNTPTNLTAPITNNGSITASNYIVLASPNITQNGTVRTGSAAYVAAGATTFTFSNGLFDILVDNAIDNAQITHTAAAVTEINNRTPSVLSPAGQIGKAYFVAVPKNDAMSLLLTGNIGYPAATIAGNQSGAVVLSAGTSVKSIGQSFADFNPVADAAKGSIQLTNGTYNADLFAHATGNMTVQATGGGTATFGSRLGITSETGTAELIADNGSVNVTNQLTVSSLGGSAGIARVNLLNGGTIGALSLNISAIDDRTNAATNGGTASITINNGTLSITNELVLDASAISRGNDGSNSTGGTASISLTNANFEAASVTLRANAQGANADGTGNPGGFGQGGSATFETHPTTDLAIGEFLTLSADGQGGQGSPANDLGGDPSGFGGTGTGGTVTVSFDSGAASPTFQFTQPNPILSLSAGGNGGGGQGPCFFCNVQNGNAGGTGQGGTINFTVASGSVVLPTLSLVAASQGGNGNNGVGRVILGVPTSFDAGDGGDATGGTVTLTVSGGALTVNELRLDSSARGGAGAVSSTQTDITDPMNPIVIPGGAGGNAGDAAGGTATITVTGGQLTSNTLIEVKANSNGGDAGFGDAGRGLSGLSEAGTASVTVSGGSIDAAGLAVLAEGRGSTGAPAGNGQGGTASLTVDGGTVTSDFINVAATGIGGRGSAVGIDGYGAGIGGSATISIVNGGTVNVGAIGSGASGFGDGEPGTSDSTGTFIGGAGSGGNAHLILDGAGSTLNVSTSLGVAASGFGGFGESSGGSGDNSAAFAELAVSNGAVLNYTGTDPIVIDASAGGGGTVAPDDPVQLDDSVGGTAIGGTAQIVVSNATLNLPVDVRLDASAFGGDALGQGGNATGGTALIRVTPGSTFHADGNVVLDSSATAGGGGNLGFGGIGTGGFATFDAVAGTTEILGKLTLLSRGTGGYGDLGGSAGAGVGNVARLILGDGNPNVTIGELEIDSSANGGDATGIGNQGGSAQGGEARINSFSGIATITGITTMKANAIGGLGGTGKGGDGTGGIASLQVVGGNTVHAVGNLTLEASGTGGSGVGGGKGTGGTATINAFGGTGNFDGKVTLRSIGRGGDGLDGSDGGAGLGNITIVDLGTAFPAQFTIGSLETDSGGIGGDANDSGRNGGAATGGTSSIGDGGATNGSLTIAGTTELKAGANGGRGGTGTGGNALGGTAVIGVGALNSFAFNDDVTLNASALGGDGGALAAGSGTGGTAKLEAFAGTIPILGTLSLFANGAGGFGLGGGDGGAGVGGLTRIALGDGAPTVTLAGLLTDSGAVGGDADGGGRNGGSATGGTSSVGRAISTFPAVGPSGSVTINGTTRMVALARGGLAGTGTAGNGAGGAVDIAAVGPVTLNFNGATTLEAHGTRATAGSVNLTSNSTQPAPALRFASLNVDATGPAASPSFTANMVDDRIVVTNNATINVGGDANFVSTDNGGFDVGGTFNLTAGGAMNVTHFGADTLSVITANNARFTVGDFFASDSSPVLITNLLEIDSGFKIRAKKLKAGTIVLKANDDVIVTEVDSPISAEGKNVTIANDGDLAVTSVTAQQSILVSSLNGSATVGNLSAGNDPAFGGNVTVQGKTFVTFNGTATTPLGSVIGFAPTINVNGKLEAPFVYLTSSKLVLGPTAALGKAGLTNFLSISNNGTQPSTVGGPGGGPGYVISESDLQKMHAKSILLGLPKAGVPNTPDVTVQNFTVNATDMFGTGDGQLKIDTDGTVAVMGAARFTNTGADHAFAIEADDGISVVTDGGSIKMFDAANLPSGKLILGTDNAIVVASQSAINDLAGLVTTQQREARLSTTDNPSDEGALVAGGMEVLVRTAFYVQNSGTGSKTILNNRRGFTVGTAGLKITNSDFPLEMIINGKMVKTPTTFYLGDSLIPQIDFETPTEGVFNYNLLSSVNGCVVINAPCVATAGIPLPPMQDVVNLVAHNDPPTGDQTGQGPIQVVNLPLIQFAGSTPYSFAPPIDEPVTGAGNQDLWGGTPQMPTGGTSQQAPLIDNQGCGGPGQMPCQ